MRAERDRRAAILTAEAEKQSRTLQSEGIRQSEINQAEGQKQARILAAERSEERRVGKSVDLGGRRIIKKKKIKQNSREEYKQKRHVNVKHNRTAEHHHLRTI